MGCDCINFDSLPFFILYIYIYRIVFLRLKSMTNDMTLILIL